VIQRTIPKMHPDAHERMMDAELKKTLLIYVLAKACEKRLFEWLVDAETRMVHAERFALQLEARLAELVQLPQQEQNWAKRFAIMEKIAEIVQKLARLHPICEQREEQLRVVSVMKEILRTRALRLCEQLLQLQ
jgi:hypothetical protein